MKVLWAHQDKKVDLQKRKHEDRQLLNEIAYQEDLIRELYEGK